MAAPHRVADRLEPLGRLLADFDFADDTRLLGYHRLLGGLSNFHRAFLERILARRQGTVRWVTLHPRMVFTKPNLLLRTLFRHRRVRPDSAAWNFVFAYDKFFFDLG